MMRLKSFFNAKGLYYVMIGLLFILTGLIAASVYFGNKFLTNKTAKLVELKLESKSLDEQQLSLIQARKDIDKYSELEKTAEAIVPQDKDQARTVREIIKIAANNGIIISNISFPSSNLGQTSKKPTTSSDSKSTSSTTGTPPAATTAPPTTQVKAADGIPGLFQLEVNVQSDANATILYADLLSFLDDLEHNRRTAQVSSISVQPDSEDRNRVTFTLTLVVYIKP